MEEQALADYDVGFADGVASGYKDGVADAEPKWIPCAERLPDKDGLYVCRCLDKRGKFFMVCGFYDGKFDFGIVTHWCQIPEWKTEESKTTLRAKRYKQDDVWRCSNCEAEIEDTRYCQFCGARMEEQDD